MTPDIDMLPYAIILAAGLFVIFVVYGVVTKWKEWKAEQWLDEAIDAPEGVSQHSAKLYDEYQTEMHQLQTEEARYATWPQEKLAAHLVAISKALKATDASVPRISDWDRHPNNPSHWYDKSTEVEASPNEIYPSKPFMENGRLFQLIRLKNGKIVKRDVTGKVPSEQSLSPLEWRDVSDISIQMAAEQLETETSKCITDPATSEGAILQGFSDLYPNDFKPAICKTPPKKSKVAKTKTKPKKKPAKK